MNIKVCGITTLKQLMQLDGMDIEFAGLIFCKDSPRYMADKIPSNELKSADPDIRKVGVFVNPTMDEVRSCVDEFELDIVQLHGDEPPQLCRKLAGEVELIKVFRMDNETENNIETLITPYDESCDYYLFDTAGPKETIGGRTQKFNWNKLLEARIEKPFFLSGDIGPEDAELLRSFSHPDLFAIDINSRFEKSPGVKEMSEILRFKQALK
jgi:phosphoribosylanthranilate isomerase